MSAAFTTQLRSGRPPVQIASGAGTIAFRVEAAELWDAVRVVAMPTTPVSEVKQRVLTALLPNADFTDDYVLKLRGWELLDQGATLADSEVVDGSILLLAHRRRRVVR
jgi:hypothetical protein